MNSKENIYEGIAIVEMHLNGGFTKVLLEATLGIGLANGGISWDISTEEIPHKLRNIGSRFYLEIKREGGFLFEEI